jgi:Cu(I)/Ag(I) efflux system membrane fusion protein
MKHTLLLPVLALVLSSCGKPSPDTAGHQGHEINETKAAWISPMHPWIKSDKPGQCPVCGMDLIPMTDYEKMQASEKPPSGPVAPEASSGAAPGEIRLEPAQDAVLSAQTEKAGPRRLERSVRAFGRIEYIADTHVDFTWFYPLRVEKLLLDTNTTEVAAGAPVLEVYSEEAITDQEMYLDALRERWLATFYERRILTSRIEAVAARLRRAGMTDDDLRALAKNGEIMTRFILRAPKAGSFVAPLPHVGERFDRGQTLFHLAPLDSVWFVADVFEQDLAVLKQGLTGRITTKADPGREHTGKIVFIGRSLNAESRTIPVRFLVPNPERHLLPQLSGTVDLSVPLGEPAVVIPRTAVIETGRRSVAYVKTGDGRYQMRELHLGLRTNDHLEVLHGIAAGEEVVVSGAFLLDAEARIRGTDATGAGAEHRH